MKTIDMRHALSPSRECSTVDCSHDGRAKQSFKEECDINTIMANYGKTGLLPDMIKTDPQYGDFSAVPDYKAALNLIQKANEQFDALPSKVRARFENDPAQFLAFAQDPANGKEMVSMGLATQRKVENSSGEPPASSNKRQPKVSSKDVNGGQVSPPSVPDSAAT